MKSEDETWKRSAYVEEIFHSFYVEWFFYVEEIFHSFLQREQIEGEETAFTFHHVLCYAPRFTVTL